MEQRESMFGTICVDRQERTVHPKVLEHCERVGAMGAVNDFLHPRVHLQFFESRRGVQVRMFNGTTTAITSRYDSKEEALEALTRLLFEVITE